MPRMNVRSRTSTLGESIYGNTAFGRPMPNFGTLFEGNQLGEFGGIRYNAGDIARRERVLMRWNTDILPRIKKLPPGFNQMAWQVAEGGLPGSSWGSIPRRLKDASDLTATSSSLKKVEGQLDPFNSYLSLLEQAAAAGKTVEETRVETKTPVGGPVPPPDLQEPMPVKPGEKTVPVQETQKTPAPPKPFPWLLVLGGVAVVGVGAFFLMKKPTS